MELNFYLQKSAGLFTLDLAAKETIVRCRSFFSCGGVRAGSELALAGKSHRETINILNLAVWRKTFLENELVIYK